MIHSLLRSALTKVAWSLGYVPVEQATAMLIYKDQQLHYAHEVLGAIKVQIERVDALKEVDIDGYEIQALTNLVDDHEELESRIEAILALGHFDAAEVMADSTYGCWLPAEEVGRLLVGGKRVPDTVEEIAGE